MANEKPAEQPPISANRESVEPTQTHPTSWDQISDRLPKIVPFRELCRCGDEIWIENDGQLYRLRRTKQGKLILTK
jgi:hemin uptake protein HemP